MGQLLDPFATGIYSYLFNVRIPKIIFFIFGSVFLSLIVVILIQRKNIKKKIKDIYLTTLLIYFAIVYCHTVVYRVQAQDVNFKLMPFWSYIKIAKGDNLVYLVENILNVLLFLPLGLLFGVLIGRGKWKLILILGVLASAFIEFSQLLFRRGLCEFDDLFHNTIGCLIGYYVACCLMMLYNKERNV